LKKSRGSARVDKKSWASKMYNLTDVSGQPAT